MAQNRYIVVMAGGKGERFWPQSRQKKPKQLLPIVGEDSLLAQTVRRVEGLVPLDIIFVITNSDYAQAVADSCPMLPRGNIVAEPEGRDTAAAVGLGGLLVRARDAGASFAVLPSDHVIHDCDAFRTALKDAFDAAESGDWLVTVGIPPEFPATGYGYINRGDECMRLGGQPFYKVKRFVEKPALEVAKQYLAAGDFYWNAGMFIWRAESLFSALARYAPDIHAGLVAMEAQLRSGRPLEAVLAEGYPKLRKISIDFALMEKADNVLTTPGPFDWDDVGSWPSLVKHIAGDKSGNVTRGDAVVLDGNNNIVIGESGHLVALMGLSDCIVVHTADVTMICPRDKAQDIRKLVREVAANPRWSDKI